MSERSRQLDLASLALLAVGLINGIGAYWLVTYRHGNALLMIPSIAAATTGARHLFKYTAARDGR